jgi:hypothetical protein
MIKEIISNISAIWITVGILINSISNFIQGYTVGGIIMLLFLFVALMLFIGLYQYKKLDEEDKNNNQVDQNSHIPINNENEK